MERLQLRSDRLQAEIAPAIGGAVTRLDLRSGHALVPILRPSSDDLLAQQGAAQAAMYPLVPFANRVPGNIIDLVDPPLELSPNVAGEPCALHGIGWQSAWRVAEVRADRCALELTVSPEQWAFGFRVVQTFSLEGGLFRAEIAMENVSDRPVPAGLGFHPYFVRVPGMMLQFHAERFWLEGPGHLPTDAISLPPELDFSTPAPIPEAWRNNCYSGWDGQATLHDPVRGLRVHISASDLLRDLMLYVPPETPCFALEPQSHTTGAATRARRRLPARSLRILAPSQRLAAEIVILVQASTDGEAN